MCVLMILVLNLGHLDCAFEHIWVYCIWVHLITVKCHFRFYNKISFSYSKMLFQFFFFYLIKWFFFFLISNTYIPNAHKRNTLSNACIPKCTQSYNKMNASQINLNAQSKRTCSTRNSSFNQRPPTHIHNAAYPSIRDHQHHIHNAA